VQNSSVVVEFILRTVGQLP